jgi:DNA mismatch endonuclease, patch repair protein
MVQDYFGTTPARSRNMRAIKATRNRTTEWRLRARLAQSGIRGWCVGSSGLPGSPDFVFHRAKLAVFADGCFWHSCPRCGHTPKTNRAYWEAKIARNKRRDRSVSRNLRELGYQVTRIWECELRTKLEKCLQRIQRAIEKSL